jgi:hypothetical protein
MILSAEAVAALVSGEVPFDLFLFVDSNPAVRCWTGVSEFDYPGDDIDLAGGTYLGMGELVGLPELSQLINGQAERVEFTISGVSPEAVALADESASVLRSCEVSLGVGLWDRDMDLIDAALFWPWQGTSDAPRIVKSPGTDGAPVRQLVLSVGTMMTSRRRARYAFWTDVAHQQDHPGDTFFKNVALYNAGTMIRWP